MKISVKTGIEHRLRLSEVKSPVKLRVLFGKTKDFYDFYGIFPWNFQTWLIRHGEKDGARSTEIVYRVSQKSIGF